MDLRTQMLDRGTTSWELEAAGDQLAHDLIVERLAQARPGDHVLSEEGRDDRSRLGAERVWIVDPLDGTNEFGSPPRGDWAVHVALVERRAADAPARWRCPPWASRWPPSRRRRSHRRPTGRLG